MRLRTFASALLVLTSLATSGVVHAQQEPEMENVDDPAVDAATKTRLNEGVKLFQAKKYEAARVAFLQAYLLKKSPQAVFALAQASGRSGHHLDAVKYFQQYLTENPNPPAKLKQRIDDGLADARKHLAQVKIVAPIGAEVTVDGTLLGKTPLAIPIDLAPGTHSVVVALGDDSTSKSLPLEAGNVTTVTLEVKPKPKGPPPPAKPKAPKPITPTEENDSILSPPETTWPMYVTGAIGLVGIGTAVVFGSLELNSNKGAQVAKDAIESAGQKTDVCNQPTIGTPYDDTCAAFNRNLRSGGGQHTAFLIGLGVGITGISVATLWYLFAPKEKSSVSVVPNASPTGAGATIVGTF